MSKKNNPEEAPQDVKPLVIIGASISDDFCNYQYEVRLGTGKGDIHQVKGKGIVDADMGISFFKLAVHLAVIDDIFKHSGEQITSLKALRKHEHASLYRVTGFKIKGGAENECVVLTGTKEVSCSGQFMNIETPKIPLDDNSSYKWHKELREAVEAARFEVEEYRNGKYTEADPEEKEPANQLNISSPEAQASDDLESGRV